MVSSLAKLYRIRLSLFNGASALAGVGLFPAPREWSALAAACAGVTLLAMGGSALNQVLERDLDGRMPRTSSRPLPTGRVTVAAALLAGVVPVLAGTLLLCGHNGLLPPLLGLAALAWYLAVYTPLKRRTALALPLGALCGAVPPLIGWTLAGGGPADFPIVLVAGLIFLWQVPHFWLLQERYAEEYRAAGIPLVGGALSSCSREMLCKLWMLALVAGGMLLPATGLISRPLVHWYVVSSVLLAVVGLVGSERLIRICWNSYPGVLVLIVCFSSGCN